MKSSILKHMSVAVMAALALVWSCSAWADDEVVTSDEESTVVEEEATTSEDETSTSEDETTASDETTESEESESTGDLPFLPPMVGASSTTRNVSAWGTDTESENQNELMGVFVFAQKNDSKGNSFTAKVANDFTQECKVKNVFLENGNDFTIDLCQHTISSSTSWESMFKMQKGTLIIKNGTIKGSSRAEDLCIVSANGGSYRLDADGVIDGNNYATSAINLSVGTANKFTMAAESAVIKNCKSAVMSSKGKVTMSAGTIANLHCRRFEHQRW